MIIVPLLKEHFSTELAVTKVRENNRPFLGILGCSYFGFTTDDQFISHVLLI